jgi:glyoxylase-like metal-dependent hydrolase (beta-lactamase superfamily II)
VERIENLQISISLRQHGSMAVMSAATTTGLRAVDTDLFAAEDRARLPGGLMMPIRMTVVRLPGGGVLVHSPTPLRDGLAEAVAALGPVRVLVAPSLLHHVSAGAWHARFPEATLWGAPGLRRKRPDLAIGAMFDEVTPPWADTFTPLALGGCPSLNEVVFFHAASRSLVCSDLLFNVRAPEGWAMKLVLTLAGTRGRLAMSRAWRRYGRDRAALRASLEQMLAWRFARVLPGHGDVFEAPDAPAACRAALAWAFGG